MNSPATNPATTGTKTAAAGASAQAPGRPTRLTWQLAQGICKLISMEGVSDTHAGLLMGVPRATLSRWKVQEPELAFLLEQARALFHQEHLRRVQEARRPDGSADWRASAWILQRMFPEMYGTPAQRQQAQAAEAQATGEVAEPTAREAEGAVAPAGQPDSAPMVATGPAPVSVATSAPVVPGRETTAAGAFRPADRSICSESLAGAATTKITEIAAHRLAAEALSPEIAVAA